MQITQRMSAEPLEALAKYTALNFGAGPHPSHNCREVVASEVIEHLHNLIAVMEQIQRASAPGAIVRITLPHYPRANASGIRRIGTTFPGSACIIRPANLSKTCFWWAMAALLPTPLWAGTDPSAGANREAIPGRRASAAPPRT